MQVDTRVRIRVTGTSLRSDHADERTIGYARFGQNLYMYYAVYKSVFWNPFFRICAPCVMLLIPVSLLRALVRRPRLLCTGPAREIRPYWLILPASKMTGGTSGFRDDL